MAGASEDDTILARVRAQVMVRDESAGGWFPTKGGGLSLVTITKHPVQNEEGETEFEYIIAAKRLNDQVALMDCVVLRDFEYNKVMPTFHHWKTGEKRYGLTFPTAADARAFDKGLRIALKEFLDDDGEPTPVHMKQASEFGDDDVFMSLTLPAERIDSHSSSGSSSRCSKVLASPPEQLLGQASSYLEHRSGASSPGMNSIREYPSPNGDGEDLDQSSGESTKMPGLERCTPKHQTRRTRQRCRYCHELFDEDNNLRGTCSYAPDCMRTTVDGISCIRCARCMLYHCMSDAEGEFERHPCRCQMEQGCGRKWLGLIPLSFVVPCLCLYPPLNACHWCCVQCGLCGGQHRSVS